MVLVEIQCPRRIVFPQQRTARSNLLISLLCISQIDLQVPVVSRPVIAYSLIQAVVGDDDVVFVVLVGEVAQVSLIDLDYLFVIKIYKMRVLEALGFADLQAWVVVDHDLGGVCVLVVIFQRTLSICVFVVLVVFLLFTLVSLDFGADLSGVLGKDADRVIGLLDDRDLGENLSLELPLFLIICSLFDVIN